MEPDCYCLNCLWEGMEEDLIDDHTGGLFACCPACGDIQIVFLDY